MVGQGVWRRLSGRARGRTCRRRVGRRRAPCHRGHASRAALSSHAHSRTVSERLRAIADLVPARARVADIGTDHARLLVHVLTLRDAAWAIGIDCRESPLAEARRTLAAAPVAIARRAELRLGDGLAPLQPGEVDTIVIAGMGGRRIAEILEAHPEHTAAAARVVLQPTTDWPLLRRHLAQAALWPFDERIVWERGRPHWMIAVAPAAGAWSWDEEDIEFGPCLRRGKDAGYLAWLAAEHRRLADIFAAPAPLATWARRVDAELQRVTLDASAAAHPDRRSVDR